MCQIKLKYVAVLTMNIDSNIKLNVKKPTFFRKKTGKYLIIFQKETKGRRRKTIL